MVGREWRSRLEDHCAALKGHRVVWWQDTDLYLVKLMRSSKRRRNTNVQQK
ncbi:MAG: hypothetical protein HC866_13185 [Leptolyngbyaceae cyanobacterium RU_5_1]|nr:hypothetical protein [Leptolyngbyaceae cyanobacterium RU_5_1]